MLKVNNFPLMEDDMVVLLRLKQDLEDIGKVRFKEFKHTYGNIMTTCPIHAGKSGVEGDESKPSFGISTQDKVDYKGNKIDAGACHCFTCGFSGDLQGLISVLFGYDDDGRFGAKWLIKNFVSVDSGDQRELTLNFSRGGKKQKVSYLKEEELETFRYTHDYVYTRGIGDDVIEKFDIGYDKDFKNGEKRVPSITFPQRDKQGRTIFITRRSVKGKTFSIPATAEKSLYGLYEYLESIKDGEDRTSTLWIVESQFNCLSVWEYGKKAIALYGTGKEEQYEMIRKLPARNLVLALDPDEAGGRGMSKLYKRLRKDKVIYKVELPNGKDINDLTKEEFENLSITFY